MHVVHMHVCIKWLLERALYVCMCRNACVYDHVCVETRIRECWKRSCVCARMYVCMYVGYVCVSARLVCACVWCVWARMCMYVCLMFVCVCVRVSARSIYIDKCTHDKHIHMLTYTYTHADIYIRTCWHIHTHMLTYTHADIYTHFPNSG
jgi:hypothetical protein